jgi:hypothetical protein
VTIAGLFFTFQAVHNYKAPWGNTLLWQMTWWYLWVVLFPLVRAMTRRFPPERHGWRKTVLVHILAGELITLLHTALHAMALIVLRWCFNNTAMTFWTTFLGGLGESLNLQLGIVTYTILVSITCVVDYYNRLRAREIETSHLQVELAQTQFQTMKMQLHPEFLFSTLRSIAGLMREEHIDEADSLVARLGDFLRLTLEDIKQQEVPLQRELMFLQCYLDIEQICRQQSLPVSMDIEPQALDAQVPNMILQPMVESAFDGQEIGDPAIAVTARQRNGSLLLQVGKNRVSQQSSEEEVRFEVRTRLRLKQLYGDRFCFQVTNSPEGRRLLSLEIPLIKRDPAPVEGVLL